MSKTYILIYIPELQDNFHALWNKETKLEIGDIVKVQNHLFHGDTIFYAEVLKIEEMHEMKVRDFMCV